jgi:NitT/TauT family transport system permease protein
VSVTVHRVVLPALGVALALLGWWLFARGGDATTTPTPWAVFRRMGEGLTRPDGFLLDLRLSVLRVLIGVAIGCTAAVPVGFALAWFPVVRAMFNPLVSFFRALPPLALIPLAIVTLGIGETARISVLTYAAFFTAVIVIFESVASVDDVYVRAARALGATELELFRRVVVPLTVPQIFVGVRVALGVSWATVVAAELAAAQRGLGAMMRDAQNFFHQADVYAGIVMIGLSALLMDLVVQVLMRVSVRWQERVVR